MKTAFENLSLIVAMAQDRAIGRGGDLLCHLPADMKHFKETTSGHTVIMGRRTFDSLPKGALPNRRNIVVTRNPAFAADRVETAQSLEEAFRLAAGEEEVFVIGGAQVYKEALPFAAKIYLTEIEAVFPDADVFFPEIDRREWLEISRTHRSADEKNACPLSFVTLARKEPGL